MHFIASEIRWVAESGSTQSNAASKSTGLALDDVRQSNGKLWYLQRAIVSNSAELTNISEVTNEAVAEIPTAGGLMEKLRQTR